MKGNYEIKTGKEEDLEPHFSERKLKDLCSLDNLDFGSANRKKGMIKFIWLQKKGSCNCGNDTKSKGHYVWVSLEKFKTKDYSISHSRKLHLPYLI